MIQMKQADNTQPDTLSEECAAIAQVIYLETVAFQRKDFAAWQEFWLQADRTEDAYFSSTAGLNVFRGWREISANMKKFFDEDPVTKLLDFGQDNMRFSLNGDTALVVYDGWDVFEGGHRGTSYETRFLERQDGQWKISYSSCLYVPEDGPGGPWVSIDENRNVLGTSKDGLSALKGNPILTVSAGRLRALRLEWDKVLRKAAQQAGRHHGFFETHSHANKTGGPVQYPVVFGQTDDGAVAVVHLCVQDGVTYIRLGVDEILDRRLRYAQVVFGLSAGQLNVARQIALGETANVAAENLGISVNTARTHISRLFEKTGVSSQTALVRLLLSVG